MYPSGRYAGDAFGAIDDLEWAATQRVGTIDGYGEYLRTHPAGRHIQDALHGIDDVRWGEAKQAGTAEAFNGYLAQQPSGGHRDEARAGIDQIQWRDALTADTVEAAEQYLLLQPNGQFVGEARRQIDDLRFEAANSAGTVEAFEQYLLQQPQGQHADQARDAIEHLAWQHARDTDTPAAYLAYLRRFPEGRYLEGARQQFAALRAPVPGAVYTGETSSGAPVKVAIDADGLTVLSLDVGLAAFDGGSGNGSGGGSSDVPVAATRCYSIASLTLNNRGPIGDDDRAFTLSQRGSMDLVAGEGAVAVEAEAQGTFTEGEVHGTLGLHFVDRPGCDAPPIAWSATAP
jgi:hypothetical protein